MITEYANKSLVRALGSNLRPSAPQNIGVPTEVTGFRGDDTLKQLSIFGCIILFNLFALGISRGLEWIGFKFVD